MSFCEPHLERTGEKIPAVRMGMCDKCASGLPISSKEMLVNYEGTGLPKQENNNGISYAEIIRTLRNPERKYVRVPIKGQTSHEIRIKLHNESRMRQFPIETKTGKMYVDVFRKGESYCGGRNGKKCQ